MIHVWCPRPLPIPVHTSPGLEVHDTEVPPPDARVALAPPGEDWPRWQRAFPHVAVVVQATGVDAVTALSTGADEVVDPAAPPEVLRRRLVRAARSRSVDEELVELRAWAFESRDMLERVLQLGPDPIVVADLDGRILHCSDAAVRLFGFSAPEVIERLQVTDLYADPSLAAEVMHQLHAGARDDPKHAWTGTLKVRSRTGDAVPVQLHAGLLRRTDGVVYASVGVLRDLRERRDFERRLERSAQDLLEAEQRASTGEGLADTVGLKQPLTAAMGWVEMLEESHTLSTEDLTRVSRVASQLQRLARAIEHRSFAGDEA